MTDGPATCGTYSGYQQHKRHRETPCRPCKDANRDYSRARRANNPAVRASDAATNAARSRAVWRLAAEYPERYRQLYLAELKEARLRQHDAAARSDTPGEAA